MIGCALAGYIENTNYVMIKRHYATKLTFKGAKIRHWYFAHGFNWILSKTETFKKQSKCNCIFLEVAAHYFSYLNPA
jgi:hypothetical protein